MRQALLTDAFRAGQATACAGLDMPSISGLLPEQDEVVTLDLFNRAWDGRNSFKPEQLGGADCQRAVALLYGPRDRPR